MSTLHVLFKVDEVNYAVAANDVLHLESFTGATRVPGVPPYVAGLVQIRQRVVPVVDLRARFGLPPTVASLDSRVMVVQSGTRAVGLLVDSAREVLAIEQDSFRPPPEVVSAQAEGFVVSVAQAGARLVMLVDLEKIIGQETPHVK